MRRNAMRMALLSLSVISFTLYLNCSRIPGPATNAPSVSTFSLVSTEPYNFMGTDYQIQNYRLNGGNGPVYFQIIPGCNTLCPVVVVSMPYNGIPWSGDANDLRWSNAYPSGGLAADIDGPDYVSASGGKIAYYNSSIAETVGFGGLFLPSNVTAVLVYNRFYLGRKMDKYVDDFVQVVNSLSRFSFIDKSRMGFLGASLGGFVSLHASRKTDVQPIVIAGITPLIDLRDEYLEMTSAASRITTNPALLSSTQNFFDSYVRRMNLVDRNHFTAEKLAIENSRSKILVIHDTWDTIVSIGQYMKLKALRPLDAYIFQHSGSIDFNSYAMDHAQASEGYTNQKVVPIYMTYLLNRLKPSGEEKIVYYSSTDFLTGIAEIKAAHDRGQNISWLKNFFDDLCGGDFKFKDYAPSGGLGTLTGEQMAGGLIVNVWNRPTTIDGACNYLASNPTIFQ